MSRAVDDFTPIPLKIDPQNQIVLCIEHSSPACVQCVPPSEVLPPSQYEQLNIMARALKVTKFEIPPPPNVVQPTRSAQVNKMKEEGNVKFRAGNLPEAVRFYSAALEMALGRPPWEPNALMRDEASVLLCNRSAAFTVAGQFIEAYADADAVVKLKRPWGKGHFRRGKALIGLQKLEQAREAFETGLAFEPESEELKGALKDLDALQRGETPTHLAHLATQQQNQRKNATAMLEAIIRQQQAMQNGEVASAPTTPGLPGTPAMPGTPVTPVLPISPGIQPASR